MDLNAIHGILFNAQIMFMAALAIWSAALAARSQPLSGNFFGAVATNAMLAVAVLIVGIIMFAQGLRVDRPTIYFLYMAWLIVIMPGLFSILRGSDDRSAALKFAILATFNVFVSLSMWERGLVGPWQPGI